MGLSELLAMEQYSPQEWDAQVDYDSWAKKENTSQVFIHWGGPAVRDTANSGNINGEKAQIRAYEGYHVGTKGWRGLAYDWVIGQSGTLYRVRGLGRSAATSGDVDEDGFSNNAEGEAILCLLGEGQQPSTKMLATLNLALEALGYNEVYGHQEAKGASTACPGPDLMQFLAQRRSGFSNPNETPTPTKTKKPAASGKDDIMSALPTVRRGDRGPGTKRVQALLNLTGRFSLKTDGMFGPQTERAVEEYQELRRLVIDGIVGKNTWKSLLLDKNI